MKEIVKRIASINKDITYDLPFPIEVETEQNEDNALIDIFKELLPFIDEISKLQKELNFDLTTLLKAFRNGIHYINEGKIEWAIPKRFVYNLCRLYVGEETYFKLEDYGKTWALTKEELI